MRQIFIGSNEAEQRLDKMLFKYFRYAPKSFIYKMLRKKNITRNGKKADGSEMLHVGDELKLFLSDETIDKFTGTVTIRQAAHPRVVYEDDAVVIMNKPAGLLSQKAKEEDVSLVEQLIAYLVDSGQMTTEQLKTFHPSLVNRLDRNTTGLVVAGKTLPALQALSKLFHDRTVNKYYHCIVKGTMTGAQTIHGYLVKDPSTNQVHITKEKPESVSDAAPIVTEYRPLGTGGEDPVIGPMTYVEVHLITGRPHQIRAHLASIGHPIAGDSKYGDNALNEQLFRRYGVKYQLLHSCRIEFPKLCDPLSGISNQTITAKDPRQMREICEREHLI